MMKMEFLKMGKGPKLEEAEGKKSKGGKKN